MYPLKIKEKYDQNNLNSLGHRFTVVYLGTYKDGDYKEYVGSHPGVDIIPVTKNQDVLSVLDGKVFKIGEDGAYGKFIFIEHLNVPDPDNLTKTTTLYSCYEHLSKINVNIGDIVSEGDVIGKTGNTGNSFGEHLHFQIDRVEAPFHAYWPFTGAEVKAAGTSFTGGVNMGLGIDKARMYTVNPLVYLDKISINKYSSSVSVPEIKEIIGNTKNSEITYATTISNITDNSIINTTFDVNSSIVEEKLEIISSSNDSLVSNSTLDALSSLDEKKNLKI